MSKVLLNHGWELFEAPLNWKKDMASYISRQNEGWMDNIDLPCDVHMPLINHGKMKDPVVADHCYDAEWIEERSWWYRKTIVVTPEQLLHDTAELTLESLDVHADVFINGVWLGHHSSAHYPFISEVKPWLREGTNELLIRLTTGLEYVDDQDLAEIDYAVCTEEKNDYPDRGDKRRSFIRKPTYTFGWDWCPRIATCGITKNAWLLFSNGAIIRDVYIYTRGIDQKEDKYTASLTIHLGIEQFDIIRSKSGDLSLSVSKDGQEVFSLEKNDFLLNSGMNHFTIECEIEDAKLWWPNGMGDQPLYELKAAISCDRHLIIHDPVCFAIRTVKLNTERINQETREFAIEVNNVKVFCKGGNWIPADSIYARVSDEKYQILITEAKNANFNMLRIWGGGLYERDIFYETCDRAGILIWHDFMFGCSTYPDHIESFYDLVRKEIDYQTKRLRNHACIALFCGNNENHWIFTGPGFRDSVQIRQSKQYGLKISNILCPEIIKNNCSEIPYWNSSPYGGKEPNSPFEGDDHHWHECMMNPNMAKRIEPKEYDLIQSRFVSEYGYPGPCAKQTIEDYFGDNPIDRNSMIWRLHNNTFEKYTVNAGIAKHYTDKELDLDEYLLYAGMTQAHMLNYSLEAMRFKTFCNGAIFWMYNDCWGEVGWTIIDYYLRRKISYYAVARAFMPKRLILRTSTDGSVSVTGCNDHSETCTIKVAYGFSTLNGQEKSEEIADITMTGHSRDHVLSFKAPIERTDIIIYVRQIVDDESEAPFLPSILYAVDTKQLDQYQAKANIISVRANGNDLLVDVSSETFCHGVYLKTETDHKMSDNYFDLLPGERRTIRIYEGKSSQPELCLLLLK